MFGLSLVSTRYLEMLDKELTYYREKAQQEQRRADRLHDQLLGMHGHEPVTETVREGESQEEKDARETALDKQRRQMIEMFADELEQEELELPAELEEDAKRMIEETMQPGNAALALFKKKK